MLDHECFRATGLELVLGYGLEAPALIVRLHLNLHRLAAKIHQHHLRHSALHLRP